MKWAFFNGQKVPATDVRISPFDLGFTMGVSVTEQIRTYRRQTPLIDRHLDRLLGGLEIVAIAPPLTRGELVTQISDLVAENGAPLEPADELGIGVCITPGIASAYGQTNQGPTTLIYTYDLKAADRAAALERGVRLTSVQTTEIPAASIPKALKCRSRMHYYLAEREAEKNAAGSRALLHDADGFVAEGTTASVIMVDGGQIIAPRSEAILPGVTLGYALKLAKQLGIDVQRREISRSELESADEVMWLTTPLGIVPVTQVNGHVIGGGQGSAITGRLIDEWESSLMS